MSPAEFTAQQREVERRMAEVERKRDANHDDGLGLNHFCGAVGRMVHLPLDELCNRCGKAVLQ